MKKALKVIGYALAGLILIVVLAALLIRFVFKEQMIAYVSKIEEKERIDLLRHATPYASDTVRYRFVYRQDTIQAQKIHAYFRLDTLLTDSSATTWDKTLTLATFVASHIPHANQTKYPQKSNAIDLWEYTRKVEPAFNCRLHAILLHELMLAEGITNRFVTCLPADTLDSDCHVVNLVWLPEQNKWAMIDSDMQAWISNPEGTPLSLAEMRERYISGSPMQIHPLLDGTKEDLKDNPTFTEELVRLRLAGYEPRGLGVYGYAAVRLWSEMVRRAGSFDFGKVDAQRNGKQFELPWGKVDFVNGNALQSSGYEVYQIVNGEYAQVD